MSAMTDFLEDKIRQHLFRTGSYTKPTDLTLHLYTAAPGETGGGTEVSGGSYAAVSRAPLDANWSAPDTTGGLTDNVADVVYPAPTGNWGTISHTSVKDQAANMLLYGALTTPKTVNSGDPAPKFVAGSFDVTFA